MSKVNKNHIRMLSLVCEKFGALIPDAPNESIRNVLRQFNAQRKFAEEAKKTGEMPDKVATKVYKYVNDAINIHADFIVNEIYKSLLDSAKPIEVSYDIICGDSYEHCSHTVTSEEYNKLLKDPYVRNLTKKGDE